MKLLIMCEGPNELKLIELLLDNDKLKFDRDDLLDMRPFHARPLTSPQLKPALDAYHVELSIYRIGDKMSDDYTTCLNLNNKTPHYRKNRAVFHYKKSSYILFNTLECVFFKS